ncbi:hypothetical protein ACQWHR_25335, partial [Salmonella enterica subsp. enterica serovar Infantis]
GGGLKTEKKFKTILKKQEKKATKKTTFHQQKKIITKKKINKKIVCDTSKNQAQNEKRGGKNEIKIPISKINHHIKISGNNY